MEELDVWIFIGFLIIISIYLYILTRAEREVIKEQRKISRKQSEEWDRKQAEPYIDLNKPQPPHRAVRVKKCGDGIFGRRSSGGGPPINFGGG